MAQPLPKLAGQRFGRVLVLDAVPDILPRRWQCRCDCGVEFTPRHGDLMKGNTRSCGCLRAELLRRPTGGPAVVRFERYVQAEPNSGCHIWIGTINQAGYGKFWWNSENVPAHRAAWLLYVGQIPSGFFACHRCDNPPCVNPAHLFLGTPADNLADMAAKGRAIRGCRHPRSYLTDGDVLRIRDRYFTSGLRQVDIAQEFGLTQATVSKIIRGDTWRHIAQSAIQ